MQTRCALNSVQRKTVYRHLNRIAYLNGVKRLPDLCVQLQPVSKCAVAALPSTGVALSPKPERVLFTSSATGLQLSKQAKANSVISHRLDSRISQV